MRIFEIIIEIGTTMKYRCSENRLRYTTSSTLKIYVGGRNEAAIISSFLF